MKKIKDLYLKYREIVDYLFWGGMAFVLYMVLIWIFQDKIGMKETVATFIDNIICIIFAFFTNKFFVFRSKSEDAKGFVKEFLGFFAARVFTLILSEILVWLGCDVLGYNKDTYHLVYVSDATIVQLITQFVVIVANYIFSKLLIFKKKPQEDSDASLVADAKEE